MYNVQLLYLEIDCYSGTSNKICIMYVTYFRGLASIVLLLDKILYIHIHFQSYCHRRLPEKVQQDHIMYSFPPFHGVLPGTVVVVPPLVQPDGPRFHLDK